MKAAGLIDGSTGPKHGCGIRQENAPARRMRRYALIGLIALLPLLCACDYARMRDDEAYQTYQTRLPEMPQHAIPITGGIELLATANPDELVNPLLPASPEAIETGKARYAIYCDHCHGPRADGKGTVGQSFAPLPTDLKSPQVQTQTDGMLFYKISLGFKRHPPLAHTIRPDYRWAIIDYLRAIAKS